MEKLITPPADSADAENLRVWYGVERRNRCRFNLEIYDLAHHKVRDMLDQSLGPGYYNFYWDKRDDSNRYVEPGTYLYKITDCGKIKYGNLKVEYKPWERTSAFVQDTLSDSVKVIFELLEDSARVSLRIYNGVEKLMGEPVVDSLMNRGRYTYTWRPDKKTSPGYYYFRLYLGDYTRELKILYKSYLK
ncbi:MAG: hypothetical protein JXA92_03755 [candidate division Zixibacteria bacterium]|nr:hypothetical protein [candidate division Zixibacteria bacterium]